MKQPKLNHYLEDFPNFLKRVADDDNNWFVLNRKKAFKNFSQLGFPKNYKEEWKYSATKLANITNGFFKPSLSTEVTDSLSIDTDNFAIDKLEPINIYIINGTFAVLLSDKLIDKLEIINVTEAIDKNNNLLQSFFENEADKGDCFAQMATAFMAGGVLLNVTGKIDRPIHIIYYVCKDSVDQLSLHNQLFINVEDNASAKIIFTLHNQESKNIWVNLQHRINLCKNSVVNWVNNFVLSQDSYNINKLLVETQTGSKFNCFSYIEGSQFVRNEIEIDINHKNVETNLSGIYLAKENQFIDNYMPILHKSGGSTSSQTYKGILNDEARAVFYGKIDVLADAAKTSAHQLNKTLLLSKAAQINARPELKIACDDVKCSHGCAIGEIDEKALFYLKARGISSEEAKSMLVLAFTGDILASIDDEILQNYFTKKIEKWLA